MAPGIIRITRRAWRWLLSRRPTPIIATTSSCQNADAYVRGLQWDATKGVDAANVKYGGAGYGGENSRPDLSNTSFLVDALKADRRRRRRRSAQESPGLRLALPEFGDRAQHHPVRGQEPRRRLLLHAAAGGGNHGRQNADGGLRSYGSMTYAGLKSMIYAGVGPDDPRVKAAYKWVQSHYDVEQQPGHGRRRMYYYYQAVAKAPDAIGTDESKTPPARSTRWRTDLIAGPGQTPASRRLVGQRH